MSNHIYSWFKSFRWHLQRQKYFISASILSILFSIVLGWFSQHLFMNEFMKRGYATLAAPIIGFMYRLDSDASDHRKSAPSITLLKVTDADLRASGASYPPSHTYHAQRLNALLDIGIPKALFIDILFLDERKESARLRAALCNLRKAGTKIYLASIRPRQPISSDFNGFTLPAKNELIWPTGENACDLLAAEVSVWKQSDPNSHTATSYSLSSELNSAAYQIYLDLGHRKLEMAGTKSIALVWGTESTGNASTCRRLTWSDFLAWPDIMARALNPSAELPYCPYFKELTVGELNTHDDAQSLIDGQIVFYGMQLAGINDHSFIPVSNKLVHSMNVHAMALDNLLVYGNAVKIDKNMLSSDSPLKVESSSLLLFHIFILLSIIFLSALNGNILRKKPISALCKCINQKIVRKLPPNTRDFFLKLLLISLSPILIWPAMLFGHSFLNLGVLSWIEYTSIFLLLELFGFRRKIEQDLKFIFD